MPERPLREISRACATSRSPSRPGLMKVMLPCAATAFSLWLLQAKAKAESASAKMKPPCAMRWPFTICGCTIMESVARPGPTSTIVMPSETEASSSFHIASAQAHARSSGDSVAFTFTSNSYYRSIPGWSVRTRPGISRFSGAQLRTIVRCGACHRAARSRGPVGIAPERRCGSPADDHADHIRRGQIFLLDRRARSSPVLGREQSALLGQNHPAKAPPIGEHAGLVDEVVTLLGCEDARLRFIERVEEAVVGIRE